MEYGITGNIQYQYRRWNAMSKNCQMPLLFWISFSRVRNKDQNWSLWALPMHSKNSNLKNLNYFGDSCLVNSSICSLIKGKNNDSITRLNASQTWCHSWFRNVAILGEYLKWRSFLVHLPTNNMELCLKKWLLNQSSPTIFGNVQQDDFQNAFKQLILRSCSCLTGGEGRFWSLRLGIVFPCFLFQLQSYAFISIHEWKNDAGVRHEGKA